MDRPRPRGRLALLVASAALLCASIGWIWRAQPPDTFAGRIASLSEPGGYFDTDNLISNERSYLDVGPALERGQVMGGAYIGVGPDTNFSYIAQIRPAIAFIIDIRRDNLLLHLLFKSLFALSGTRLEYLTMLLGRPMSDPAPWASASIERLVAEVDRAPIDPAALNRLRARVDAQIRKTGVPLTARDFETIDRFHRRFVEAGLDLRFHSAGRPPQLHYPTYRDLLLETGADGRQRNFLASDDAFRFVRTLQARDLVIPVVGDLSGPSALRAIASVLRKRGEKLSAVYVSNVEFYLFGAGTFPRFVENLASVPRSDRSLLIRSIFNRYASRNFRPGSASISVVQSVDALVDGFAAGRFRRYGELVENGKW